LAVFVAGAPFKTVTLCGAAAAAAGMATKAATRRRRITRLLSESQIAVSARAVKLSEKCRFKIDGSQARAASV
jgi:hypothetical protein